jgi:UPF0176 protein
MFCTGGIRCEKAAPLMEKRGFNNVFQLEGGILNYFETCGEAHFYGDCFVFDERVSLDSKLRESGKVQCLNCFRGVSKSEQKSPDYVPGKYCPHCKKEKR